MRCVSIAILLLSSACAAEIVSPPEPPSDPAPPETMLEGPPSMPSRSVASVAAVATATKQPSDALTRSAR